MLPAILCASLALLHAGSVGIGLLLLLLLLLLLRLPGSVPVYCQSPGVVGGAVRALQSQYVEWHLPCLQETHFCSLVSARTSHMPAVHKHMH